MTDAELDVLVAQQVMKFAICTKWLCLPEDNCRCPIHDSPTGAFVEWPERGKPWSPSTDIATAWVVVERMLAEKWGVFGWDGYDRGRKWLVGFGNNRATADTAPRAICLAALKALRIEVTE